MSRRDSRRDSLANRQQDVLEEFETFKKKYLLVNKHIAKLNSSLTVKVEELSTQIATLNIENLRLRASEQSLARKLQREKARTRWLVGEAEAAAHTFLTQFTSILSSSSRSHSHPFPLSSASSHHRSSSASSIDLPSPSNPQPLTRPKAVKPIPKEVPRLSKAPKANTGDIQGIDEDDEGDGEADRTITLSTPVKKRTPQRELRRHSLPTPETPSDAIERQRHSSEDDRTPHRTSTPPRVPLPPLIPRHPKGMLPPHIDLTAIGVNMRKGGVRRKSGLLNRFPPPPASSGAISASTNGADDLERKMRTLERLPLPRPPSPIIGSPKANAEKVIVPSASEDEGVTTSASASEIETDEMGDVIPRTTLDFSTTIARSESYASSYSQVKSNDRRSAVSSSGFALGDVQLHREHKSRSKENGKSKDASASLRDVTNEGTASIPEPTVDAKGRKVALLPERADRESKKRLASTAFEEDDHPTLPSTTTNIFSSSQLPPRSASSNGSTIVVESYSVPLKDDAPSNEEESGRSRRQRSSVNYAEPSLKAKMRKPRVEGPMGLKTRKSDGDGLGSGYNSDGTGLIKERVKRKKSVKGLAELAAAASASASASENEHSTPPMEASTTTNEAEMTQPARRRPVSYHVSPNSDSEAAGDEDEEYGPTSLGHAGTWGSSSSKRRLGGEPVGGSASEGEGLRRWSVAC